jgi:N-acetylmuramoyl-L-alanine amidase
MALTRLSIPAGPARDVIAALGGTSPKAVGQVAVPGIESSACIAYPALHGNGTRTVFIDAGHGGLDPGVVGVAAGGGQVLEKNVTLAVAERLTALLREQGYRVVMARTQDTSVLKLTAADSNTGAITADAEHRDLLARVACANASGAAVLLSIHFDGFVDPSVGGTETFYDDARTFSGASQTLASDLQAALVAQLGASDRGVWTDDKIAAPNLTTSGDSYGHLIELGPAAAVWVDVPSQMPGALVEPLFITNPAEAGVASDPTGQQHLAQALDAGLIKFLSTNP